MNMPRVILVLIVTAVLCRPAVAGDTAGEYVQRRARLAALMDSSTAVILKGAERRVRSNDVAYRFRQESNLLYLTGADQPGQTLVVVPGGVTVDGRLATVLFLASPPVSGGTLSGPVISDGLVLDESRLDEIVQLVAARVRTLYVSAPDIHFVNDWLNNRPLFLDRDSRKEFEQKHPGLKIKNVAQLLARLRQLKSPAEIALMQKAIMMTGDGILSAMRACAPGAWEYELQAAVEYEMIRQGADCQGFPSIIGSGPNSLIPHYDDNHRQMKTGEVVVIDVGAEYGGYSADVTRTIPVSGTFTKEQRGVYELVLRTQRQVIGAIKAGVSWRQLEEGARKTITDAGFGKYITHGVSHHVGLDVHDMGLMDTLRAGMVITVEPGIYIPASDTLLAPGYRGFGVRIEDDVLVTDQGATVLSEGIPKDAALVEKVMKKWRGRRQ